MVDLRQEFHAAIGVVAEILDGSAHDLGVADHRLNVVGRVYRGIEQTDHPDGSLDLARHHVIADFEWPEHEDERAGGEIGQEPTPGRADRNAKAGDQSSE